MADFGEGDITATLDESGYADRQTLPGTQFSGTKASATMAACTRT